MVKAEKGRFITQLRICHGKRQRSTHPSSAFFEV
jgi:hypothetical protein